MKQKIRVFDIDYDIDYDNDYDTDDEIIADLPNTIEFMLDDQTDTYEMEQYISDEITNITGFCHNGFNYGRVD